MKLIPIPSLRASIPAMALVAVNITSNFGPVVQLGALIAILLPVCAHLRTDFRLSWLLFAYLAACLAAGFAIYGPQQAVIKAGKLTLFCMASVLTIRGAHEGNRFPAVLALRAFLLLCAANLAYAVATGSTVFRGAYLIEFSIYSSYTIAILIYLARPHLTLIDRGAAYFFSLLCGSTMGLLALLLAELIGRRLRWQSVAGLTAFCPLAFVALQFLFEARSKSLTWEFLAQSDRGVLLTTFYENIVPTFSLPNWFFGLGVGKPLHQFVSHDPAFDAYLTRLGDGAIYSYCLHNEPVRILCDFGLVGLLLVGIRLWTHCPKPVLALLGICMLTNSYLYSFSGALIASTLFNPKPESLPSPSHA